MRLILLIIARRTSRLHIQVTQWTIEWRKASSVAPRKSRQAISGTPFYVTEHYLMKCWEVSMRNLNERHDEVPKTVQQKISEARYRVNPTLRLLAVYREQFRAEDLK